MAVTELSTLGGPIKQAYESQPDTNAFTDTEKAKLASLLQGATENSPDDYLVDRDNHTGQQSMSTITNLETELDAKATTEYVDERIEEVIAAAGPQNLFIQVDEPAINTPFLWLKPLGNGKFDLRYGAGE